MSRLWFENYYECPCGHRWYDEHDCQCDDRCPECNTSCSPTRSADLSTEAEADNVVPITTAATACLADSYKPISEALRIARGQAKNENLYRDTRESFSKIVALLEPVAVPVEAIDDAEAEAMYNHHVEDMVRSGLSLDQARAILSAIDAFRP